MNQIIDLLLKYPMILPVNEQKNEFKGYLPINGIDYEIHVKEENGKFNVNINQELKQYETQILQLTTGPDCRNVIQMLDGLTTIIGQQLTTQKCKNFTDIYRHILSEYMELREFYINMYRCSISDDLLEIRIAHSDECNRIHDMVIHTDLDNEVFKVILHSLPQKKDEELFQPSFSLKIIYEQFVNCIEKLQMFFDVVDNLDNCCWVMDPEKPTRKDCYRRIGLGINISMIVTFDPWSNISIPDIKFLGSEKLVENFRYKVAKNLENWNQNANVLDEILNLLEMSSFPKKPISDEKEEILLCHTGECCICFSLRLNDRLPEIICQNSSCEQFFHSECLYQWLVSVNAKQGFNELHGQCPNCEKHISCPL